MSESLEISKSERLARHFDQMAWQCEADAQGAPEPDKWHLENAAYFYRAKARNLHNVTSARALSEGVMSLAGVQK
jgi:hypothetical protein